MNRKVFTARFVLPVISPPLEDGAFLVVDDKIVSVGPRSSLLSANPEAEVCDFGDRIILPPMTNAHTHLELTHYNQWAEKSAEPDELASFVDWLLKLVRVKQSVEEDEVRNSLASGLRACLKAGTGAIGDILSTLNAADTYRQSPLRGTVFAEVLGHDEGVVDDRLKCIEKLIGTPPASMLKWGLSPHSLYTLSLQTLSAVDSFSNVNHLQKCTHIAESHEESEFLQDGSGDIAERLFAAAGWSVDSGLVAGRSPIGMIDSAAALRPADLVVHGVQVSQHDIVRIKQSGCSVVLCPRSNAALGVGKAPLGSYLKASVPLAMGTDSIASAPSLSVWDELAFARSWFDAVIEPGRWLYIATLGGSRALGSGDRTGALSEGFDASFQVVSLPGGTSFATLEGDLCDAGSEIRVEHLYLAGRNCLP